MIVCNFRNSTECKDCSCDRKSLKPCLDPQSIFLSERDPPYGDAASIPVQSFEYFCENWNVSKNSHMICAWAKQGMISDFTLALIMLPCLSNGLKQCIIYCTISINLAVTWIFCIFNKSQTMTIDWNSTVMVLHSSDDHGGDTWYKCSIGLVYNIIHDYRTIMGI